MINNAIDNPKLKAQSFKARFLEAGVVKYEEEMVLIKPENLMKIGDDFKGAHVIIDHQDVSEDQADEKIVGYITNVWFNPDDGWAWCDFTVNSEEAISLINQGYSVSCAYYPEYAQGGTYHNIPYDREIMGGEAIHLAIVENPRYEDAIILKNSIKKVMTLFKFKKEAKENKVEVKEIELENAMFEIAEGENVAVSDMVEAYKNAKEEKEKEEKENEKEEEAKMNADSEIEVDGEMIKVSELAAAYKASKKKNAEDEEKKEKEEAEAKKNEEEEEEKEKAEAKKNSKDAEKIKAEKEKFENGMDSSEDKSEIHTEKRAFDLGKIAFGNPQEIK